MDRNLTTSTLLGHAVPLTLVLALSAPAHAQTLAGKVTLESAGDETVFTYRGRRGPATWGALDPEWTLCGEGEAQSPIDLRPTRRRALPQPWFDYHASAIEVLNNGHTVEFVYQPGSTLTIGNRVFELLQFHFHTPSEHTFAGGAHFPVEMHLVHKDARGRIAVVGVMLVAGEHNPALPSARRWGQLLPREAGVVYELEQRVDVGALLPHGAANYRYRGSLTTPPCSEGVLWMVMRQPVEVSPGQLAELREALGQLRFASRDGTNNRPVQPLNDRVVVVDVGPR